MRKYTTSTPRPLEGSITVITPKRVFVVPAADPEKVREAFRSVGLEVLGMHQNRK